MSTAAILTRLQKKLGITTYALNKRLGFKSKSLTAELMSGKRGAGIKTIKRIITLCEEVGLQVNFDDFSDDK